MAVTKIHKIARSLHNKGIPFIPSLMAKYNRVIYGCYIPHTVKIGEGTSIGYDGIGVVIHFNAVIGKNCVIGPNCVIGGTSGKIGVPVLGDNVALGAGCKIFGPVTIGNNVMIGANSVVTIDVPDNCMVAGMPARIIKNNIDITRYNKLAVV